MNNIKVVIAGKQGPPGPGIVYTNSTPTPVTLGGILAGSTFSGALVTAVLDRLLYPYQVPSFSSFNITGQAQTVEVGTPVSGSKTFAWSAMNSANVNTNSVAITGPNSLSSTGNPVSGSIALSVGTNLLTAPGSATWNIDGVNTNGVHFSSTFAINWLWRVFAGTSTNATLSAAQIQAFVSSTLASLGAGTYSLAAGGYKYFCYPTSMPAAATFTDISTNLSVTMADSTDNASFSNVANGLNYAIVSVTNSLGQTINYRVYRSRYQLGGAINIAVS